MAAVSAAAIDEKADSCDEAVMEQALGDILLPQVTA